MHPLAQSGHIELEDQRLDYRWVGPAPDSAPTVVMLHEGLGCQALWGDLPDRLAAATGLGVMAYSRVGYGSSSPKPLPWAFDYMHTEAQDVLPRVLDAVGFKRGVLIGSSDGASIATIYAGSVEDHRVCGLVLVAPHFIVEDETAAGARAAKAAFEAGDLRAKLERRHDNVEIAFYGWNQKWTDPEFKRSWDITEYLPYIRVPIRILQGENDEYATVRQLRLAEQECLCPVEATLLPGLGHSIHREAPELCTAEMAAFIMRVLR
ncbi:MAG: alpha/beta fold hydrolase [Hyphomicrobiaceae bacterium]